MVINNLNNFYCIWRNTPDLILAYGNCVDEENAAYKLARRSEFTAKKADADHQRDELYSGIDKMVRLDMKHFNPDVRDAAVHVNNLMSGFGNVPREDYDAETASIDNFLGRIISSAYAGAVSLLRLGPWLLQLQEVNDLFKTYVDDTTQEQIAKPGVNMPTARRHSDEALRKLAARIESRINIYGPAPFVQFLEEYNTVVKHYNTLAHENYGRKHVRTDVAPAIIAPIGQQQYTGKPVFVIPEVSMRVMPKTETESETVVELVFSQDFTVAYKNNIEPGTATLTIQGIGKYRGEVVTTVNIARSV
jgi:hypothetical protein